MRVPRRSCERLPGSASERARAPESTRALPPMGACEQFLGRGVRPSLLGAPRLQWLPMCLPMASNGFPPRWPWAPVSAVFCWPPRGRLRSPVAACGCAFAGALPAAALPPWIRMARRA
eukprot:6599954-Pyramimonas_sp.AAC.1